MLAPGIFEAMDYTLSRLFRKACPSFYLMIISMFFVRFYFMLRYINILELTVAKMTSAAVV